MVARDQRLKDLVSVLLRVTNMVHLAIPLHVCERTAEQACSSPVGPALVVVPLWQLEGAHRERELGADSLASAAGP